MLRTLFSRGVLWVRDASVVGGLACLLISGASAADAPKEPPKNPTPPPAAGPRDPAPAPRDNKDTRDAKDAAKDVRDNAKDVRDNAKDAAKDVRDNAKDATRDNRDAKDNRDPRDTRDPRDNRDNVKDNVRDTTRDVKDTARDVRDNVKDTARDVRDTARDVRDGVREGSKDANRDAAREGKRRSAEDWGLAFGKANDRGVPISKLNSSSVAYKAGLRDSDVIVSVNGHAVRAGDDFERWVYDGPRTERVKVIVWRGGREEIVYLEPTVLYTTDDDTSYIEDYKYFGVVVDDRYPNKIVVKEVYPDSPAFRAGLREGDVITTWRGERVATLNEFGRLIRRADPGTLKFEFNRDSKSMPGEVKFDARATRSNIREERREERRETPIAPIRNR